ncbi:replication factor C large subunit [Thermosphaera chiliense]|uniref:Replication factor C large subunit n=1 Tax=Thermosphaera chiliense TaxID=3402707 RepID=A0A7M1UQ15_9CREN|nr:replication factor C large subunit [Thermosphaera aggregans]QOR94330.1 replication factor C large subunit [Thermosphaera aggregans]
MSIALPWIIKYRPKTIDDVVNQEEAKQAFLNWLDNWGKPGQKKAALLHGPAGCGKTSLVEAVARSRGYQLFEMNASDFRRKSDIEGIARIAAQTSGLASKRKIILLDEVDGINTKADEGGIEAIIELINVSRNPVVMTANNPYSKNLLPLRQNVLEIPMKRLTETNVVAALKKICSAEKIECNDEALREIAKRSEGDLRSAINDLQAIAETYGRITLELVKSFVVYRDRQYAPYEALQKLFNAKYLFQARDALTSTDLDYDELFLWLNEHIPTYYEDPEEVVRAYEALSRADVYYGRIIRRGQWDLLSYMYDMMGPGVAFARKVYKYRFKPFRAPVRKRQLSETRRSREVREALAEHLASRLLASKATVKAEVIPYLQVIFKYNLRYAARIARGYSLSEEHINWLAGSKASEVIGYMKRGEKARERRREG